jgi:hypothetical protein
MKKLFLHLFCAAGLISLLSACADPVVFSEVFQLKQGERIYTRYNLWYTDPENISCLNKQQGTFIPLGTEIEPLETTFFGQKIIFKDVASGKRYVINFDEGYRLCPMQDFIAYTFTTKDRETLLENVPENVRPRILRGEVVPGMNQYQVLLAYGPPPAIRTTDLRNESWIYWINDSETIRVVWRGDTVKNILNINK